MLKKWLCHFSVPREVGNFERDGNQMMLNTENSPILRIHNFAELK